MLLERVTSVLQNAVQNGQPRRADCLPVVSVSCTSLHHAVKQSTGRFSEKLSSDRVLATDCRMV